MQLQLQALVGIFGFLALGWAVGRLSNGPHRVSWYPVLAAVILLFVLATVLQTPVMEVAILAGQVGDAISREAHAGIRTVFGRLADPPIVFATAILPAVIYFSALMSAFYYLGIMQRISQTLAFGLRTVFRGHLSDSEAIVAAVNVFAGQTEAPLSVKPYVQRMSDSELVAMMACGFATISAPLGFVYSSMLSDGDAALGPYYLSQLIAATLLSIPAALLMARLVQPSQSSTDGSPARITTDAETAPSSLLDAIALGAKNGVVLAVNIGALLIAIGAILALIDLFLVTVIGNTSCRFFDDPTRVCAERFRLSGLLGSLFSPVAWLIGVEWSDSAAVGRLLGEQLIATEFIAFGNLADMIGPEEGAFGLSLRSTTLAIFALTGFASLPSVGVQIGALSAIAPSKRSDIVRLAPKAMGVGLELTVQ